MNRVCQAIEYLKVNLNSIASEIEDYLALHDIASDSNFAIKHNIVSASLITSSWVVGQIPSKAELDSVIECLEQISNALEIVTTSIPSTYNNLTVDGANSIEKMMQEVEAERKRAIALSKARIDLASQYYVYSNEIYGGEE